MKLQLDMSPEAAALVRKMYENGELDDIVASMVRVDEPQDELANRAALHKEMAKAGAEARVNARDLQARVFSDRLQALVNDAGKLVFAPGTIHYGVLGEPTTFRTDVHITFKNEYSENETVIAYAWGDNTQRNKGDKAKIKVIGTRLDMGDSTHFTRLLVKILDD